MNLTPSPWQAEEDEHQVLQLWRGPSHQGLRPGTVAGLMGKVM